MFSDILAQYDFDTMTMAINAVSTDQVVAALAKESLSVADLPVLFSEAAGDFLEPMAQRAAKLTKERFGNTMQIYAPLYLSNECGNSCLYCGFSAKNKAIVRRTLSMAEAEAELQAIAAMGIRHMLLLTGEAPAKASLDYIAEAVRLSREYADFTAIEIFPLDVAGYKQLVEAGADGLTLYQETYNAERYDSIHPSGKKKDMKWRLDAPDRGAQAGMRSLGVGPLLGLSDPRTDAFFAALHAHYLMTTYWRCAVSISLPRMRAAEGCAVIPQDVPDKLFVQFMTAIRLALPDVGFVVSTREAPIFRDNIVGLGVTQMSAASATEPGGYTAKNVSTAQFQVEDSRSVAAFSDMLMSKGYEPVMKDWDAGLKVGN
ncbi:MAG: 2-iminoacetate synthase ThiH [Deferribacteraceae bacterium]|nr:2-iminoacetate synthase ThiH [Deferribacteraceae bacterium]